MSEILLLFLAILRYRKFGPKPKPESNCCCNETRYIEPSAGERLKKGLFVVWRLLLNSNEKLVPLANDWEKPKFATPVFDCNSGTP